MGKPIVYCEGCGASLKEEQFASGKAGTHKDRNYCAGCLPKGGLLNVSPPPTPPKTVRAQAPPPPARDSRTPLLAGGALAIAAFLVLIVILATRGGPVPAPPPPEVRDPQIEALKRLETFASSSTDPDAILLRCEEARRTLRGTPHEPRVTVIAEKAQELKVSRDRQNQVEAFFRNAKSLRDGDSDFRRRAEFLNLCEAALKISGLRRAEVEAARDDYERAFEARGSAAFGKAREDAEALVTSNRHDEALAGLEGFPATLRSSKAAAGLETLRADLERRKEEAARAARTWVQRFREAGDFIVANAYAKAKPIYLETVKTLPRDPPDPATRNLYVTGIYNLACTYGVECRTLKGDARKTAADEAFKYLEWALRTGYGKRTCSCHKGGGFEQP